MMWRWLSIPLLLLPLCAQAALFLNNEQEAMLVYEKGDYPTAAERFTDPYRKGVAYYRAGKYDKAAEAFAQVQRKAVITDALYNLGNSYFRMGDYKAAAKAYREALVRDPKHEDARYNLSLVTALLARAQKEQEEKEKAEAEKKAREEQKRKEEQKKKEQEKQAQQAEEKQQEQEGEKQEQQQESEEQQSGEQESEQQQQTGEQESEQQSSGEQESEQQQQGELAVVHDGKKLQPAFALIPVGLRDDLQAYLQRGGRKLRSWCRAHRLALADYSDQPERFTNINDSGELQRYSNA